MRCYISKIHTERLQPKSPRREKSPGTNLPGHSSVEMNMNDESESSDMRNLSPIAMGAAAPSSSSYLHDDMPTRCIEAPYFVFENDDATFQKAAASIKTRRVLSFWHHQNLNVKSCISTCCCFMLAVYFVGYVFADGNVAASPSQHLKKAQAARENMIAANQERILLQQLSKDRQHLEISTDLVEHVTLLQQELEQATTALGAERKLRKETEQEIQKVWSKYQELTTELSDVEAQMQDDVGNMYQHLALEQFGHGPHYAEFQVRLWGQEEDNDNSDCNQHQAAYTYSETLYFTVETTPIEHMPASVFLFLQQVDHGLWDGTSFYINAPHALVAQPLLTNPTTNTTTQEQEQPLTKMERMGLARASFHDYNEEYIHKPYTLGFTTGNHLPGPNFFVNKVDNTAEHHHHHGSDLPCFAKVIIGTDTIDRMSKVPTTTRTTTGQAVDYPYHIIQPVEIVRVRLFNDLQRVHGGKEYLLHHALVPGSSRTHHHGEEY